MAKIQRSFYIEEETAKWLKISAAELGLSASAIIEHALAYYRKNVMPGSLKPTEAERLAMLDITDSLE